MFSVVPMMRLQTIVLAQDERAVLKSLGQLGAVHLTHMLSGPDTAPLAPIDRTGELARYESHPGTYSGTPQIIGNSLLAQGTTAERKNIE